MITQKLKVNLIPSGIAPRVNVSQYDYGSRTLEISLYNGTEPFMIPENANIFIQGTKKDGRGFQYEGLAYENNVVTADITQQMTVFEDEVVTELVILVGDQQLATANFILNVEPAALRDDVVVSETDIPAIQDLPEAMAEVRAAVVSTAADAQAASGSATAAANSADSASGSATAASGSATAAGNSADDAEAWAVGKIDGVDVPNTDPRHNNNAKHYSETASGYSTSAAQSASAAAASESHAGTSETNAHTSEVNAAGSATSANSDALVSEGWAKGTQNGVDVPSTSPYYHNNSKYFKEQAEGVVHATLDGLSDVEITNPQDGDGLIYDAPHNKWVNGAAGMKLINVPIPKSKSYTYNGTEQTFEWDSIDADHVVLSGNKQTNAGNYTVTANLKGVNDAWINADGTVSREPKTFTWNIAKATGDFTLSTNSVSALMPDADPTVNVTDKVGDGTISVSSSAAGVVNPSYNAGIITLTKVSAGTATVTVSLAATTNYTAQTKTIAVTLTKANQTFDLSANSVSLTSASPTASVNISNAAGDGAFSASSSDPGVATASVSGNVVSITGVADGSATITVTKAATTNYNAKSKTIAASATFNVIVTLTLNGAKEDNITIKDSDDNIVGTCVFPANATQGTCQILIPSSGGVYKFVSSVGVNTETGNAGYEKNITLNGSNQTVNVFPDGAVIWGENFIVPFTAVAYTYQYTSPKAPTVTHYTNYHRVQQTNGDGSGGYQANATVDFTNYSALKAVIKAHSSQYGRAGIFYRSQQPTTWLEALQNYGIVCETGADISEGLHTKNIANVTGTQYIIELAGTPTEDYEETHFLWLE